MTATNDPPLWRLMDLARLQHLNTWAGAPEVYAAMLEAIAEITERRGELDLDRDPGETADWLRAEAARARQAR